MKSALLTLDLALFTLHLPSEDNCRFSFLFFFLVLFFDWCVDIDYKCHKDVDDDIGGHDHEAYEEKCADYTIVDDEVELVPDKLPVIEQLHRE